MVLDEYPNIKSGDVIAFSGKGPISTAIKIATTSKYSHVGIVLDSSYWTKGIALIESNSAGDAHDLLSGKVRDGVQIVSLDEKLKSYDGRAWWCALKEPLTDDEKQTLINQAGKIRHDNTKYDPKGAIWAGLDFAGLFKNKEDLHQLFCSELVSELLRATGRIPQDVNCSEQTPENVVHFPCLSEPVRIL